MALHSAPPQWRRTFARFGLILMAGALAACQAVVPRTEPPPVIAAPPPPPPETIEGGIPRDLQRHRVALLVPMSGTNANVGQSIANAANMAILDSNEERVRITTYDTAGLGGAEAAVRQALGDGSTLVLGPLLAEDVRAIATIARQARVPVVSFSNDTSVAGQGIYVMGFTPGQSVERIVAYARAQGAQRFAALVPEGVYGQRASAAFTDAVTRSGGELVTIRTFERDQRALQRVITQLHGDDVEFDTILIADGGTTATRAAALLRADGPESLRILGTELWNTQPSLAEDSAMHGALFASVADSMFDQLGQRYRARFSAAPYRLSSLGYDAALLAVRLSREWSPGEPFPADALIDPGGFSGVDGPFRFATNGIAQRALEVQRIGSSGMAVVDPAPTGFE